MDIHQTCKKISRELDRENDKLRDEIESLLEIYLLKELTAVHRRLVRGMIDLPRYYKDTQTLQNCIDRFNRAREQ